MTDQNTTTPSASQKQNEPSVEQVFTPAVDAFQGSAPQVPNAGAAPQAAPFSSTGGSSPQAAPVPPAGNVPPQSGFVPPTAGMPPQSGCAPGPQNIPGLPLVHLTGGMKFGWAVVGFLMGPVAILLAWLTNAHNFPEAKKDAIKFSLFGFLAQFLIWFVLIALFGCATCAAVTSAFTSYPYYY